MVKDYVHIIDNRQLEVTKLQEIIRYFKTGCITDFIRENDVSEISSMRFVEKLEDNSDLVSNTKRYSLKIIGYEKINKEK